MRRLLATLLILAVTFQPGRASDEPALRDSLAELSEQSTVLEISDVLFHRDGHHYICASINPPVGDSPAYVAWLRKIAALNGDKDSLLKLLNDPDAKIRTLSMAALASRDDVTVLPAIAALVHDLAPTFSGLHDLGDGVPERERKLCDQKVSDIAQHIIGLYLNQCEDPGWDVTEVTRKTKAYVAKVRKRPACGVTFLLAITRSLDLDPASEAYADAKAQIRTNLDKVPEPDRAWISLWLDQKSTHYDLYSTDELIAMFKELGPDEIMQFLMGKKKAGTDPDAQDADIFFFLKFADLLLRPSDAGALITEGRTMITFPNTDINGKTTEDANWPDAHWLIGAARLQPKRAADILRGAFDAFADIKDPGGPVIVFTVGTPSRYTAGDEKAELCATLWQMCGESQASFIADKFYDTSYAYREDPNHQDMNRGWRCDFIDQMKRIKDPSSRKMIAYLLEDKRVETYRFSGSILRELANYTLDVTGIQAMPIEFDQYFDMSLIEDDRVTSEKHKILHQIRDALSTK